jgi:CheY-like chemotaxis protein
MTVPEGLPGEHPNEQGNPPAENATSRRDPSDEGSNELPLVLVVEDNRLNSELIKIYLRNLCRTNFARTGEAAVEMARGKRFQAIIMDINLGPGMDGIQATREIRKFEGYAEIPIIAVTGYTMESDKEQILAGGCSHYVPKPIEKNSFTTLIASILGSK